LAATPNDRLQCLPEGTLIRHGPSKEVGLKSPGASASDCRQPNLPAAPFVSVEKPHWIGERLSNNRSPRLRQFQQGLPGLSVFTNRHLSGGGSVRQSS
jgi:hypothetical protein